MENALNVFKNGITEFAGLGNDCISILTAKNPGEICFSGYHERETLSIFTRSGRKMITADQYMDVVESQLPDIFHAMCDGDTPIQSTKKRTLKAVERSELFFEKCLERFKVSDRLKKRGSLFIAPIEGGYNIKAREYTTNNMLYPEVDGYFLDGFHTNGSTAINININDVSEILELCLGIIPYDKLRIMLGAYNPVTMLQLINSGIDIVDNSYAYLATIHNCALTFRFEDSTNENADYDIDLSDSKYKDDFQPIIKSCKCLSCRKHTKAYINHLINTKELLAPILLMIHNIHHYTQLFTKVHESVKQNKLSELILIVNRQLSKKSLLHDKVAEHKEKTQKQVNCKNSKNKGIDLI